MSKDKMPKEKKKKTVVLIGFMGSGKSTVGLRLSYKLRMPIRDTDKMIEDRAGCSISDIFEKEGEEAFREKETKVLQELCDNTHGCVLSVGGGTPVRPQNRELLKKCGTVVYLRVKPETVYQRLREDRSRPLLQCQDPLARIRDLLGKRQEAYEECADLVIDVDDKNEAGVAEEIVRKLEQRGNKEEKQVKTERDNKRGGKLMKLLVINGPNLNFLGIREKNVYGTQDYQYLLDLIAQKAQRIVIVRLKFFRAIMKEPLSTGSRMLIMMERRGS